VDSAMVASQNGFCSYKLSINKKTNIMQIMTNRITFFINLIFYHREIVKLYYFNDTFLELCKHRSVMQPLQNPPFCSSTKTVHVKVAKPTASLHEQHEHMLNKGSLSTEEWSSSTVAGLLHE
jgi:hypothetical protein